MNTDSENRLDEKVREFYLAARLPGDRVARILAAAEAETLVPVRRMPRQWLAAALIVLLGGAGIWLTWPTLAARRVATEVARNHLKAYPPEIEANALAPIEAALARLDFPLAPSQPLPEGLSPSGGRYCSVGGEPAAQILLVDPDGRRCTLFIARAVGNRLARVRPGNYISQGVQIRIWHDEGRLFAMAL